MATLNWKTPNGTTGSLNLDNIVLTTGAQTIGGAKTFSDNVTINADLKPMYGITMTGRLKGTSDETDNFIITTLNNTGMLYLTSNGVTGSTEKSGHIKLFGSAYGVGYNGAFEINAYDKKLRGNPDGTLTWCGNNVLTSSDGTTGNVDLDKLFTTDGGTINGNIAFSASEGRIHSGRSDNDGYVSMYGGAGYTTGGFACYYGKNHASYPGEFRLTATNGTTTKALIGKPDGTLKWGGTDISLNGHTHSEYVYTAGTGLSLSSAKQFSTTGAWAVQLNTAKGTAPSSNIYKEQITYDNSNNGTAAAYRFTMIGARLSTGNETGCYMTAYNPVSGATGAATIGVYYPSGGTPYTAAPTPATTDNSTKIATTEYVKSNLSSYLPLSGGTLTGNLNISKTDPTIQLDKNNITRGTAPSAAVNKIDIVARDSADKSVWGIYSRYGTDKSNRVDLMCYKGTTNDATWDSIGVGYDASGNAFTYAPTPAQTDSTTKIATTAHVKACVPKSIGSATHPVYTNSNGVITECTYTLSKSVPSNAVFTDTKYSAFVKSGSTAAAGLVPKPSTTAGTTKYLREDATWVVPPNTTYSAFVKSGSTAAAGLVPKPSTTAGTTKYLREDATWVVPPNTTYSAGTAALLTAGTDTTNRVWTAKILSDFVESKCTPGSSIAANGYVKLDSGLIIQWGKIVKSGNSAWTGGLLTVNFPITFTNAVFSVVLTQVDVSDTYGSDHSPSLVEGSSATTTKSKCTVTIETSDYEGLYWMAFGN